MWPKNFAKKVNLLCKLHLSQDFWHDFAPFSLFTAKKKHYHHKTCFAKKIYKKNRRTHNWDDDCHFIFFSS